MRNTVTENIEKIINEHKKGTIFSIHDFYDVAKKNTVKSILLRLEKEGKIDRLIDGLYTVPEYSSVIKEYSYPSVDDVADKIAEKFSWTICPSGNHVLNILGLSTQIPNKYTYISDGPYRNYNYRGRSIIFKHASNRYITGYSKNLSLVIQAIKALGEKNIFDQEIKKLARFCRDSVEEDLVKDTKKLPTWIQEVLLRIQQEIPIL